MDLCDEGVFYEGSLPIYIGSNDPQKQGQTHLSFMDYLNKYYYDNHTSPTFNIDVDQIEKPYILFHIRDAIWNKYRNPDLKVFRDVIKMIKEKYGDKVNYYKTGESHRVIDRQFDFVAPYYNDDLNKFLKLINNASLLVCTESGPNVYAQMLGVPFIELESTVVGKDGANPPCRSKEFWELYGGRFGETGFDWLDKDLYLLQYKGQPIDKDTIMEFTDKWI